MAVIVRLTVFVCVKMYTVMCMSVRLFMRIGVRLFVRMGMRAALCIHLSLVLNPVFSKPSFLFASSVYFPLILLSSSSNPPLFNPILFSGPVSAADAYIKTNRSHRTRVIP